ncbi:thioredoxin family protein [Crocinitomix algicola]|uniref:thioredoxin family protein n=1 Tax=Crocinitomix algicola TaxID=1740263 RepID=UPI0008726E7E|nr:thioredoxin family protein [Crocinitomix algicola]
MNYYKIRYSFILSIFLFVSCGSNNEIAQGPAPIEEESNSSSGSMTIGTERPTETTETIRVDGDAEYIDWLDFETAMDRNEDEKRFIFIDMYTEWCGWCKKMDASTFKDKNVINYLDQNFYAVKFNPETTDAVAYKEVLYEKKVLGKKSYNELAINLLSSKMVFPSFVILNKKGIKRGVLTGYHASSQLINALKRYVE